MSEQESQTSLQNVLREAVLTQRHIAQKANVSPAAVSLIVNGKSKSKRIEDLIKEEAAKALEKQKTKS